MTWTANPENQHDLDLKLSEDGAKLISEDLKLGADTKEKILLEVNNIVKGQSGDNTMIKVESFAPEAKLNTDDALFSELSNDDKETLKIELQKFLETHIHIAKAPDATTATGDGSAAKGSEIKSGD